mgnify:CR=1 FL=1
MSLFLPNIPQPNDNLDFSQGQLLNNNQGLDTVFGIDHYKFSDATANKGFHNQVTTPSHVGGEPTTAANLPLLYALAPAGNLGVVQFSKRANTASTLPGFPLSGVQSTSAAIVLASNATQDVFDFTGTARAFCLLSAADTGFPTTSLTFVVWTGTAIVGQQIAGLSQLVAFPVGNILKVKNLSVSTMNNVYYTLQFMRVQ